MSKKAIILLILFLSISVQVVSAQNDFDDFVDSFAQESTILSKDEHSGDFTSSQLRILRNTVFAKHGHIFKSSDLKKYFSSRTWYTPKSTITQLSKNDELIIDLIHQLESIEKIKFSEFQNQFTETRLPISISSREFGEKHSKFLTREITQKYLNQPPCCEIDAVARFDIGPKFVALIYKITFNEETYVLATLGSDGSLISKERLSAYGQHMDRGRSYLTSDTIINKDKTIVVTETGYVFSGEYKEENKKPFTKIKKLKIGNSGVISEF